MYIIIHVSIRGTHYTVFQSRGSGLNGGTEQVVGGQKISQKSFVFLTEASLTAKGKTKVVFDAYGAVCRP